MSVYTETTFYEMKSLQLQMKCSCNLWELVIFVQGRHSQITVQKINLRKSEDRLTGGGRGNATANRLASKCSQNKLYESKLTVSVRNEF